MREQSSFSPIARHERGAAVLLLVVTLLIGAAAVFYGLTSATAPDIERDRKTAEALAIAKAALIGYAAGAAFDYNAATNRPGDLPCPDTDDDGTPYAGSFGPTNCNTQARRIGRLPWKTLGLPDLRDGDGERLWYAVSTNFRNSTRLACTAPTDAGCLNSDTRGTITVRDASGTIKHNATNTDPANSGVIAVIFSPGAALRRQDGTLQNRTCAGGAGCNASGLCLGTTTPKCNAVNYLDTSGAEDNVNFTDGNTNGFINGIVRDASGNIIVNDRLAVITYQDLIPQLEKRVVMEISKCLTAYAKSNFGRYPWAAPVTNVATPFSDGITTFGRIPDQPFTQTKFGSFALAVSPVPPSTLEVQLKAACTATPNLCMTSQWPSAGACNLPTDPTGNSWWTNWKLQIFYSVADAYKPEIVYTQPTPSTVTLGSVTVPTGCPTCLTVNPPSTTADKQFVVIAAGRSLPGVSGGQLRNTNALRQTVTNYLEGENNNLDTVFTKQSSGTTFNDNVLFYP